LLQWRREGPSMTIDEAIREIEGVTSAWDDAEAKKAVAVIKAALARVTAERDKLIEAWPEHGIDIEPQPLVWHDPDGTMPHAWAHGTERSWRWRHDTKAAAVRAAAGLDAKPE
jgi:hypothetical protein